MFHVSLFIACLVAINSAPRAESTQQPKAEPIPAPKKIERVESVMPYVPPRRDTLEVWQHYGVSPLGRFVPRVIQTEFGPLYSRDLQPYPWVQNRRSAVR
jgi:hypothetical protein